MEVYVLDPICDSKQVKDIYGINIVNNFEALNGT